MNMKDYHQKYGRPGLEVLADDVGTSPAYLSQISSGFRRASPSFASRIEKATRGAVTVAEIRPDLAQFFGRGAA